MNAELCFCIGIKALLKSSEIIGLDFSLRGKPGGERGHLWGTYLIRRDSGGTGQRQETGGPSQGTHTARSEGVQG